MTWLKINECEFINASQVQKIRYEKGENKFIVYLSNKSEIEADYIEHATTFDINEIKEG